MDNHILVVEDDAAIREGVRILLEGEGYIVQEAEDGYQCLKKVSDDIDLVILDIMMPGISGIKTCEEIRKISHVPVLFLTAKSQESDKLLGLMAGGDDYLVKPFSYAELLARVKALLRRYHVYSQTLQGEKTKEHWIEYGKVKVNTQCNEVFRNEKEISLREMEYRILLLMMENPKKVFSVKNLYESLWEEPFLYSSGNTVMVHIRRLRMKIEDDPQKPKMIQTVWGKGYRLGYVYAEETERAEELQEYVTQNKLSASDYKMLKKWGTERNIDDFTISRGKWLLFDISYNGKIMYGSREIPNLTWRMYHRISFKDGTADVYIYEGTADKYFNILMVFSVVLGVAACIGIVVSGMYENVKYIQCLMKEVNIISRGNLQGNVTVQGTDEIAQLASGLEHMRQTLVKKEQIEYDLKSAQEKLVLGMSHDLRTPLTGLMAYLEILKKQQKEGAVTQEYINKAFDRVLQIRDLSEQMFEYFFVNSRHHIELEPAEDIMCAFGDYLSELCALLEYEGFKVNTDRLEWRQISVCINTDFIGRIMNNIISNIEKYGKHENEVCIQLCYGNEEVGISIQNSITRFDSEHQKTGIGLQNISIMMEQMDGRMEVNADDLTYCIVLYFPEKKAYHKISKV